MREQRTRLDLEVQRDQRKDETLKDETEQGHNTMRQTPIHNSNQTPAGRIDPP